ncbi:MULTISPECIES: hypothetical protein [Mycobacterium]|uniref:hypothetical protein n=1 Tax=Mycobacterium TaxID=1763 RepID=UPI001EE25E20|nr:MULTISPECIES: hypothetical protein [Mycobacterium]
MSHVDRRALHRRAVHIADADGALRSGAVPAATPRRNAAVGWAALPIPRRSGQQRQRRAGDER